MQLLLVAKNLLQAAKLVLQYTAVLQAGQAQRVLACSILKNARPQFERSTIKIYTENITGEGRLY